MSTKTRTPTKPYRRFRVHAGSSAGGLDELRRMTQREAARSGGAGAVMDPAGPGARPSAGPTVPPAPPSPPRRGRSASAGDRPPKQRRRGKWYSLHVGPLGWALRVVALVVVAVLVWGIAGYMALSSAVSQANSRITTAARAALTPDHGSMLTTPTNILFIGSDARPGQGASRSDTLMIMRLDPGAGKIKYLSIPRDTLIDPQNCPDCASYVQQQKINAAYFFGGEVGAIQTVERFTGLPINHVVIVGFDGLTSIVNDLGGVTLNNPFALHDCNYPGGITVSFPKGEITLNGTTALEYVRVRDCDTDFQREERQQVFLSAIKSKIVSPSLIWKAPWNAAALVSALSTDMSTTQLAELGWVEMNSSQPKADRWELSGTPEYINGVDYVINDPAESAIQKQAFMSSK